MSWLSRIFDLSKPDLSIYKTVRKAPVRLTARAKVLVCKHAEDGMSKADIAAYYNISIATVYRVIRDAKA